MTMQAMIYDLTNDNQKITVYDNVTDTCYLCGYRVDKAVSIKGIIKGG